MESETWQIWAILVNSQVVLSFIPIPSLHYKVFIFFKISEKCVSSTLFYLGKSQPVRAAVARKSRCEIVTADPKRYSNPSELTRILWGFLATVNEICRKKEGKKEAGK